MMDGDKASLLLVAFICGAAISHWYATPSYPEAVLSGDGQFTVERHSSVAILWTIGRQMLGNVALGVTKDSTSVRTHGDKCVQFSWTYNAALSSKACHEFSSGNWYGGPQFYHARWPIEQHDIPLQQYVSDDLLTRPSKFGSILERYWLSSKGLAIYVLDDDPDLYYGVSNGGFQLGSSTKLNYVICHNGSAKDTHMYMVEHFLGKPEGIPDVKMLTYPIWSTWARYKIYINQSVVLRFGEEIRDQGFKASQLEIDDTYTTNYGDHVFDGQRFPDPAGMISQLKQMGYRVTSWVHPFVNYDTQAFQEGTENGFFLASGKHSAPGLVRWWQGVGAMVNVSDTQAVSWYKKRLNGLVQLGIDSFKFDAGEACYMPDGLLDNPNLITKKYVEAVSSYGSAIETRAAYRNQRHAHFLRMMDKHSYWGFDNGLSSMIPSALHLSIIGYNFVLPDMIGGNAMGPDTDWYAGTIPDKELYIRWFQLVTFLQSMQISIAPWQYDDETTEIAKSLVKLHEDFVAPRVVSLAKAAVQTGEPIIRPIWWNSPEDDKSYQVEDQFLIGNDVMVAPVIKKGAKSRSIYFTAGQWKDVTYNRLFTGPRTVEYGVTLRSIPYFVRVDSESELK